MSNDPYSDMDRLIEVLERMATTLERIEIHMSSDELALCWCEHRPRDLAAGNFTRSPHTYRPGGGLNECPESGRVPKKES